MRKLFSILAVALLALSAHATVVTQDWTFSDMSPWEGSEAASFDSETGVVTAKAWKGVGNWGAINRVEYDKLVIEVATHEQPIYVKIKTLNIGEEAEESNYTPLEYTMSASQNCCAFDLSSAEDVIKWIELSNWSEVEASFTIKRIYAIKTTSVEITRTLWSGENAFGDWGHSFNIDPYEKVYAGDKMVVTYTKSTNPQCQIKVRNLTDKYLDFVGEYLNVNDETEASFLLSETDVELIRENGIFLNGQNMTIKAVQIVSSSLFRGEQKIEYWSGHQQIDASDLANIKVGNILCVQVKEIDATHGEDKLPNLNLYAGGWEDNNALADGNIPLTGEFPKLVEIPVTYKMEKQLRGNYLLVRGLYYTFTEVFIKEGTPTNTVAGYLNVTDAGMATLVLPFDIPTLPTGVQAYNLTNNGDATIWATEVDALEADKPVLIVAPEGEYEFVSVEGASDDISSKTGTYTNGALVGTYYAIADVPVSDGSVNNYILSNGSDGVAFYQVLDASSCSVDPYRAYLSCGYNASAAGPTPAPMRIVFHKDGTTGVENAESAKMGRSTKFIRDGQLIILRNGVEYNANGALVK